MECVLSSSGLDFLENPCLVEDGWLNRTCCYRGGVDNPTELTKRKEHFHAGFTTERFRESHMQEMKRFSSETLTALEDESTWFCKEFQVKGL